MSKFYSCETATQNFGTSDVQCNNGDISISFLIDPKTNINTQKREYQREKVSTRSWQQSLMLTILQNTYAGIPEIHIRVIETDGTYSYELIDGQQRMRAVIDFIKGEYALPEGLVVDGCDISGMTAKTLQKNYRKIYERILEYRVSCKWYEGLTDAQTAFLFIKVLNNVSDMKPQEMRNAILGFYSDYVRDTARGDRDKTDSKGKSLQAHSLFERYFKKVKGEDKQYLTYFSSKFGLSGRMEVDEWLSTLIYFMDNGWKEGITNDRHFKWVEKINGIDGVYSSKYKMEKRAKEIDKVLTFAKELMIATPEEYKVKLNPMTSLMLVVYGLEMKNRGYTVIPEKFSPAFFDTYERWSCTKKKLYKNKTLVSGKQLPPFNELFGGKNATAICAIFKVLDMDWKGREKQVGLIEIDSRETFRRQDIIQKWQEQGGKCYYTGNPIDEKNLAGDHYIPRSWGVEKGGVTEYSNLVVCTKGLNLRKGNMSGDEFLEYLKEESKKSA